MFPSLLPLLVAFLGAALVTALGRRPGAAAPGAVAVAAVVAAALVWGRAAGGGALEVPWLPEWGWSFALALDPLGAVYALLAAGVAVPVLAYAAGYMPHHLHETGAPARRQGAFHGWMLLFLAAMVGLATAADLVLLFLFFDLTAVCSWALIGFDRDRESRRAALTALLVTGMTSVVMLVGIVLLHARHGTLRIAELTAATPGDGMTELAMLLVLVAALAKSAQVPLHFWLPRAMAAPTPVSAYLHSAAMVAAGVFVVHRLHPLVTGEVATVLAAAGWASMLAGGLMALVARELKAILAYSTVAHYGHAAVILALGGAKGAAAAAVYVAVHGVAKSALFLAAGAVTRATGSDDLDGVVRRTGGRGLGRRQPLLAAAAAVAAAALAGLPLTAGFFKDEALFQVLEGSGAAAMAAGAVALGLTVAYMGRFWGGVFLGWTAREAGEVAGEEDGAAARDEGRDEGREVAGDVGGRDRGGEGGEDRSGEDRGGSRRPAAGGALHRVPRSLAWPVAALALALLAGGLAGSTLAAVGREAAGAVHGGGPGLHSGLHSGLRSGVHFELAYHPDLRPTNLLALSGWVLGALLLAGRRWWEGPLARLAAGAGRVGPARLWDLGMAGLDQLADRLHLVEIRDLRDRVASILLPAGALVAAALVVGYPAAHFEVGAGVGEHLFLALALAAVTAAAVATLVVRSHLGMVLLLTAVGFSMAVVFAVLGAPDVALVAVLVETSLTVLFVVVLSRLPRGQLLREERRGRPRPRARWHTVAALVAGGLAFVAGWTGLSNPAQETVALRHLELSHSAHAKNVVAAILADFRALDTLGEVTVVVVAMLGLLALRRGR